MTYFYLYASIAALAAVFKGLILAQSRTATKPAAAFNTVTLALICQNIAEFFAFYLYAQGSELLILSGVAVVASMSILAAAVVHFAITITRPIGSRFYLAAFWSVSAILVVAAFSGQLVVGVGTAGYSLKTMPGDFYPLFSATVLLSITVATWMLWVGGKSTDYVTRIRSRLVLWSLSPMFLIGIGVVALRLLGIDSSSGLLMPIASTFLVMMLMKGQQDDDRIISFRLKWVRTWFYLRLAFNSAIEKEELNLKSFSAKVSEQHMREAMKHENDNKSGVARLVGSSPATISRAWSKIKN